MSKNYSFELLQNINGRRLFTAHWGTSNLEWMQDVKENDLVVFSDVSMPGKANTIIDILNEVPNPDSFVFLSNDLEIHEDRERSGLNSFYINQNAFINENKVNYTDDMEILYDVVYNARLRPIKRHYLAKKIGEELRLALIVGHHTPGLESIPDDQIPSNVFFNTYQLLPETVSRILSQSKVGIILSPAEGACFSSSEYLLCGLPVVSTKSTGGRDFWYDEYNSIICDDTEDSVFRAAQELINDPRDRRQIRETHLKKMFMHRQKFIDLVYKDFAGADVSQVARDNIFNLIDYRRYFAFQNKFSWKGIDSIKLFLNENICAENDNPKFESALTNI